jgi:hypothetical protein
MRIWAIGAVVQLRLLSLNEGSDELIYYWWDEDDERYLAFGNRTWSGNEGCQSALAWATTHGYRLTRDRIEGAG